MISKYDLNENKKILKKIEETYRKFKKLTIISTIIFIIKIVYATILDNLAEFI